MTSGLPKAWQVSVGQCQGCRDGIGAFQNHIGPGNHGRGVGWIEPFGKGPDRAIGVERGKGGSGGGVLGLADVGHGN